MTNPLNPPWPPPTPPHPTPPHPQVNLQRMMFEEIRLFHEGVAPGAVGGVDTARTTGMQPPAARVPQQAEVANDPMEQSLNG